MMKIFLSGSFLSLLLLTNFCATKLDPEVAKQPSIEEMLPFSYLFPHMPYSVGVLKKDGSIVPHPKNASQAVRIEEGEWKKKGSRLVLSYKTFNAYRCEAPDKDCSLISETQRIELDLEPNNSIRYLKKITDSKGFYGELYYHDHLISSVEDYF